MRSAMIVSSVLAIEAGAMPALLGNPAGLASWRLVRECNVHRGLRLDLGGLATADNLKKLPDASEVAR
jgi:hypothetical protein